MFYSALDKNFYHQYFSFIEDMEDVNLQFINASTFNKLLYPWRKYNTCRKKLALVCYLQSKATSIYPEELKNVDLMNV